MKPRKKENLIVHPQSLLVFSLQPSIDSSLHHYHHIIQEGIDDDDYQQRRRLPTTTTTTATNNAIFYQQHRQQPSGLAQAKNCNGDDVGYMIVSAGRYAARVGGK
jgi:hypothetical protein